MHEKSLKDNINELFIYSNLKRTWNFKMKFKKEKSGFISEIPQLKNLAAEGFIYL